MSINFDFIREMEEKCDFFTTLDFAERALILQNFEETTPLT